MNIRIVGTVVGMCFLIFGLLSLILSVAGLQFSYMTFMDAGGKGLGLVLRLIMMFSGVLITAIARTDWDAERAEIAAAE
jgi:hypothetical protein